jgi:hypothetical protein
VAVPALRALVALFVGCAACSRDGLPAPPSADLMSCPADAGNREVDAFHLCRGTDGSLSAGVRAEFTGSASGTWEHFLVQTTPDAAPGFFQVRLIGISPGTYFTGNLRSVPGSPYLMIEAAPRSGRFDFGSAAVREGGMLVTLRDGTALVADKTVGRDLVAGNVTLTIASVHDADCCTWISGSFDAHLVDNDNPTQASPTAEFHAEF